MKNELLKELECETKMAKKYASLAIKRAKEGKKGLAIRFLDTANMAKKYADNLHEKVWEITNGNLNEEEFIIFCEAETIRQVMLKAYECIKKINI